MYLGAGKIVADGDSVVELHDAKAFKSVQRQACAGKERRRRRRSVSEASTCICMKWTDEGGGSSAIAT